MIRYISRRAQVIRAYYDGIGKSVVILPAAFAMAFAVGQINLGIVFFTRDVHGASPSAVGWVAGTWALTYVFGCLVLRAWLRRIRPRHQLVTSALLFGLLTLALQFVPGVAGLLLVQAALGLVLSMYWAPMMGWLSTGSEGVALGRTLSHFNMAWCTGMTLSPFVCGWLCRFSVRLPLWLGAGVALITAFAIAVAARVLPTVRDDDVARAGVTPATPTRDGSTPLRLPAWIGHFAFYIGLGVLVGTFPLAARAELGYTEFLIGILFLIRSVTNTIAFHHMGRTVYWHFRTVPMAAWQVVGAAALGLLAFATTPTLVMLLIALYGMAMGVGYAQSLFHGVSGSLDRGRRMAIHEALIGTALFLGPIVGGRLYETVSMAAAFGFCATLLVAAAFAQLLFGWALQRRARRAR